MVVCAKLSFSQLGAGTSAFCDPHSMLLLEKTVKEGPSNVSSSLWFRVCAEDPQRRSSVSMGLEVLRLRFLQALRLHGSLPDFALDVKLNILKQAAVIASDHL